MMVEAEARIGDARREVHRHIGDFTLFWTGIYPEALGPTSATRRRKIRSSTTASRASAPTTSPAPSAASPTTRAGSSERLEPRLRNVRSAWAKSAENGSAATAAAMDRLLASYSVKAGRMSPDTAGRRVLTRRGCIPSPGSRSTLGNEAANPFNPEKGWINETSR